MPEKPPRSRSTTGRGKRVVVGIDAAWTSGGSSGVAVVEVSEGRAVLVAATPSYVAFCDLRRPPDVIAIDMPLSTEPISGRRAADNLVSSAFGAKGAGTHSPSVERPGRHGRRLQRAFEKKGYVLQTKDRHTRTRQLIEVYPHPALIRLCESEHRLPYKASKCSKYWPDLAAAERRVVLLRVWGDIAERLEREIAGSQTAISEAIRSCRALKSVEDVIDAIVCAWVGVCFLKREVTCFGDSTSAIWIPT